MTLPNTLVNLTCHSIKYIPFSEKKKILKFKLPHVIGRTTHCSMAVNLLLLANCHANNKIMITKNYIKNTCIEKDHDKLVACRKMGTTKGLPHGSKGTTACKMPR